MPLIERITRAPLWRSSSLPYGRRQLVVACFESEIPHLTAVITPENCQQIAQLVLFDHRPGLPRAIVLGMEHGSPRKIPVSAPGSLRHCLHCEIIFFNHSYSYDNISAGHAILAGLGFPAYHVAMPYLYNEGHQTIHAPGYYEDHRPGLEAAYALLEDETSRQVFASRIRALCTGNVGFLQVADYPQYFHPLVRPQHGDVVMDGGVSAVIGEQQALLAAVGDTGRVFGFEPDPQGHAAAQRQLAALPGAGRYTLLQQGLWHEQTTVRFSPAGVGSHVSAGTEAGIAVQMTTVDAVAREYGLQDVHFIKLDVEGSEDNAIRGAAETITRCTPRLAISVYHRLEDLYRIPQQLRAMVPEYRFHLGHHHPVLFETILYARPAGACEC